MYRLYYSPGACSLAPHIVLEEAGAPYELTRVRFEQQEQRSPEHLARNPLGRVPVLETDRGLLTEVPAILSYVAATHSPELLPEDPFELARMNAFNAFLSSTVHPHWAHFSRPARWIDDETAQALVAQKGVRATADHFAMIDQGRLALPWVMGERYTIADAYLFTLTRWLERAKIEVRDYPRLAEHFARMGERPAVRRALEQEGLG